MLVETKDVDLWLMKELLKYLWNQNRLSHGHINLLSSSTSEEEYDTLVEGLSIVYDDTLDPELVIHGYEYIHKLIPELEVSSISDIMKISYEYLIQCIEGKQELKLD